MSIQEIKDLVEFNKEKRENHLKDSFSSDFNKSLNLIKSELEGYNPKNTFINISITSCDDVCEKTLCNDLVEHLKSNGIECEYIHSPSYYEDPEYNYIVFNF